MRPGVYPAAQTYNIPYLTVGVKPIIPLLPPGAFLRRRIRQEVPAPLSTLSLLNAAAVRNRRMVASRPTAVMRSNSPGP